MRKLVLAAVILSGFATPAISQVVVRGHTRANGTYVPPYVRTEPNSTRTDNWSSRPNVNPITGQPGTKDPYAPPAPKPYDPYRAQPRGW